MNIILKYILYGIGVALIADGIGSIIVQPTQPFFWFQFVRCFRAGLGCACIYIATQIQ
jgi:hypothetical protein